MTEVETVKMLAELSEEDVYKLKVSMEEAANEILKEEATGYWDEGYRVAVDVLIDEEIVIRGEITIRLWLNDYLENLAQSLVYESEEEEVDWDAIVEEEIEELNRQYAIYVCLSLKAKAFIFDVELDAKTLELDEYGEYAGLLFRITMRPPDLNVSVDSLLASFKELFRIICKAIALP